MKDNLNSLWGHIIILNNINALNTQNISTVQDTSRSDTETENMQEKIVEVDQAMKSTSNDKCTHCDHFARKN